MGFYIGPLPGSRRRARLVAILGLCAAACLGGVSAARATGFSARVIADGPVRTTLGNATVRYELADAGDVAAKGSTRTDPDGRCAVTDIPEGYYKLEVSAVGYTKRVDASVVVVDGAMTPVDLILQPEPLRRTHLRFAVLLAGGVLLIVTIVRGRARSHRLRND